MAKIMKKSGIDWIGEIPEDWSISHCNAAFIRKNEKAQQDDPVILSLARSGVKVRDISNNDGQLAESYYNYNPVEPGDLLLNPMDLISGANCSISEVSGVISPAYINLKARDGFDPLYYDYYFKTQYWSMAFFAHGKGVSFDNRWTMSAGDLLHYPIPVPPEAEQKKISHFLKKKCNEIDGVISKTEQSIEEYKSLRQSIITEAVTKGVRGDNRKMNDSGIEWIGQIPGDWKMMRMKSCIKTRISGAWGDDAKKDDGDIVCMRIADFDYDRLEFNKTGKYTIRNYDANTIERLKLADGDILIEKSGGGEKTPVGRAVVFNLGTDALYANFMDKIVCKPEYNSRWLTYVFAAFYQNGFVKSYIKQTTGIQNLDLTAMLSGEKIPIPSKDEQDEIVAKLDEQCNKINDLIDKKNQFIDELASYKKSIIYEYITGKKEVPEL